jgi:para-nitrobenzyl esterase
LSAKGGIRAPIIDGRVLPDDLYTIYSEGKQNDVPLIAGWTKDDNVIRPPEENQETFQENAKKRFGNPSRSGAAGILA